MCWSAPASLALGTAGFATAGIAHAKGQPRHVTLPLAYFSVMELLQFFSYASINQCGLESNSTLTLLSYIHIAFQPFFFNMLLMGGVPGGVSPRIRRIVYTISGVVTALLLLKLVPIVPESLCSVGETLCGKALCSVSGNWHLAWQVPLYDAPLPWDAFYYYAFAVFIVPIFYGAWIGSAIAFMTGPLLAYFLASGNPNEWPAIWCFYSVALLFIALFPQFGRIMANVKAQMGSKKR